MALNGIENVASDSQIDPRVHVEPVTDMAYELRDAVEALYAKVDR